MTSPETNQACTVVALIGRPNVGKSTLFNRMTRSRQAIVDPTPGVTRDRHYDRVIINDRQCIIIDTGGIEPDNPENEMAGHIREQTMMAIEQAHVLLFIMDGREGITAADHEIATLLRRTDKPTFYLVNKIDSPELEDRLLPQFYELGQEKLWPMAAEHGFGIPDFLEKLGTVISHTGKLEKYPENTIRLAFFGRPNVGKSSLINRLSGEERMVVSNIPGTTRDSVNTLLTRGKNNFLLIDTAGIRRKGKVHDKLEKFSVIRALAAIEQCDIALILIDAHEGITDQDTTVIGYTQEQGKGCILVINKWDLVKGDSKRQKQIQDEVARATQFVEFAPVITLSALTGARVNQLFPAISKIYSQYCREFPTNKLNLLLQDFVAAHSPPMVRGRRLKFYFTTQIGRRPPTFAIVTNAPEDVHFSYQRYLTNKFRAALDLEMCPLRIVFRERKKRKDKSEMWGPRTPPERR